MIKKILKACLHRLGYEIYLEGEGKRVDLVIRNIRNMVGKFCQHAELPMLHPINLMDYRRVKVLIVRK